MNPLSLKTWLCAKFGWNQPRGSGKEDEKVYRQTDGKKVEAKKKKTVSSICMEINPNKVKRSFKTRLHMGYKYQVLTILLCLPNIRGLKGYVTHINHGWIFYRNCLETVLCKCSYFHIKKPFWNGLILSSCYMKYCLFL